MKKVTSREDDASPRGSGDSMPSVARFDSGLLDGLNGHIIMVGERYEWHEIPGEFRSPVYARPAVREDRDPLPEVDVYRIAIATAVLAIVIFGVIWAACAALDHTSLV